MKEKTLKLAQMWRLNEVTITQGMNGYPKGLYKVLTGFDTFEDAEYFAEEIKGETILIAKKNGWNFWVNKGRVFEGIDRAYFIDENNEEMFTNVNSFESWAKEEIESMLRMGDNIYDIRNACIGLCNISDDIYKMHKHKICIVAKSTYDYDIVDRYTTQLHDNDVTTYAIAVIEGIDDET